MPVKDYNKRLITAALFLSASLAAVAQDRETMKLSASTKRKIEEVEVVSSSEGDERRPVQPKKMDEEIDNQQVGQASRRIKGTPRNLHDTELISGEQTPQKRDTDSSLTSNPIEATSGDDIINEDTEILRAARSSIGEPSQMSLEGETDYGVLLQQYWQQGKHDEILSLLRQQSDLAHYPIKLSSDAATMAEIPLALLCKDQALLD